MSKLTDFKLLSFDVYGTLIDYDRGVIQAMQPLLEKSGKTDLDPKHILKVLSAHVKRDQSDHPTRLYSQLLTIIFPKLCKDLGLQTPTEEESSAFGGSIPSWPAFEDSVEALKRLQKVYKMVVLSNVDNASFNANNANSLQGFEWDLILTAEDIGSYKPSPQNFDYMLKQVKGKFGVEKAQVLQTAQSQFHDHHPAKDMSIRSSWISRFTAISGGERDDPVYNWKFDTLAEMADAVEKELADGK